MQNPKADLSAAPFAGTATAAPRPGGEVLNVKGVRRGFSKAQGELLVLEATADSAQGLAHIQDVVGRHLERFGARAALRVEWKSDGPAIPA